MKKATQDNRVKKKVRPVPPVSVPDYSAPEPQSGIVDSWNRFWFSPVDPMGFHIIRILTGLLFVSWLLSFTGHQYALFGMQGWFDVQGYEEGFNLPTGIPVPLSWSLLYVFGTDTTSLTMFYYSSIVIFLLFTLGVCTRVTSILTWLCVGSFIVSPVISYGGDFLLSLLAFYFMIGCVVMGQWSRPQSPLTRILGNLAPPLSTLLRAKPSATEQGGEDSPTPSYAANWVMRMLQIHVAIIMVVSGLAKFQNGDWWSGVAFWYPMHSPFTTSFRDIQTSWPVGSAYLFVMSLLQYVVWAWQLTFPVFAWRKSWRKVVVGGGIVGCLGSWFVYGLPLFGPFVLIGCLSFLSPEEWRACGRWIVAKIRPKVVEHPSGFLAAEETAKSVS